MIRFLLATKLTQIEFRDEYFTFGSWYFISNAEHVIFQKKIFSFDSFF